MGWVVSCYYYFHHYSHTLTFMQQKCPYVTHWTMYLCRQGLLARVLFAVNPVTISEQSECRVSCYFHSDFTGVALLHYFLCNTIGYILITFSTSSSSMSLCSCSLLSGYKSNNKHAIIVCSRIDTHLSGGWSLG